MVSFNLEGLDSEAKVTLKWKEGEEGGDKAAVPSLVNVNVQEQVLLDFKVFDILPTELRVSAGVGCQVVAILLSLFIFGFTFLPRREIIFAVLHVALFVESCPSLQQACVSLNQVKM